MLPRLEIRHLAMLAALADTGSITSAAAILGLTQSALSHRLREAERRLGTPLLERTRGGLKLTPAGDRLLLTARRLLADLARTESDLVQMAAEGVRQVARLGQAIYAALPWFAPFHAACRERLPDLRIEVVADAAERPLELLAEGALDVAIVAGGAWRPGIAKFHLFDDWLVAVAAPHHVWRDKPMIQPQDLVPETYLSYGFVVQPGFEHERFMTPAATYPARVVKVGRPEAILELIAAGEGVSILADWAVKPWVEGGRVLTRPLAPASLPLAWYAAVRDTDSVYSAGQRAAQALQGWCATTGGFGAV